MKVDKKLPQILGMIAIYLVAISLIFLPYLKNSVIAYRISHTSLNIVESVPSNLPAEETIRPPKIVDVMAQGQGDSVGVGRILIPDLEVDLPVTVGVTNYNLTFSVAIMYPERTLEKDNVVLLGHNLGKKDLFFGGLLDIQKGTYVYVKYLDEMQTYQVADTLVVKETTTSPVDNTEEAMLTLITCPTSYQTDERFVVQAKPIGNLEMPQKIKKVLQENVYKAKVSSARSIFLTILYIVTAIGGSVALYLIMRKDVRKENVSVEDIDE